MMDRNRTAKERAYEILRQYKLKNPTLDDLVYIVKSLGFEIIDFDKQDMHTGVSALIDELKLDELAKSSKAFTYQRGDIKLLFVSEQLSAEEKRYAIAHELGHIVCGHMKYAPFHDVDLEEEFEANEFVHYLLQSESKIVFSNNVKTKIPVILISVLLAVIALLMTLNIRLMKNNSADTENPAYTFNDLDPFDYVRDGQIFGTDVKEYLVNLVQGTDYIVSDVNGDSSVYSYSIKKDFEYFGIPSGSTGIRFFQEPQDGITMVCYDFLLPSTSTELIEFKLQSMMSCIKHLYGRGYDYGRFYNSQGEGKYINFDDIINGVRSKNNGSYSVTWALDEYAVSLNMNYDGNQAVSMGSIRFYTAGH